jgi:hypothetical protein
MPAAVHGLPTRGWRGTARVHCCFRRSWHLRLYARQVICHKDSEHQYRRQAKQARGQELCEDPTCGESGSSGFCRR